MKHDIMNGSNEESIFTVLHQYYKPVKKVSSKFRPNFTKFTIFGMGREYIISCEIFVQI